MSTRLARRALSALAAALAAGCASGPGRDTLATLRSVEPDVAEVEVENSLELAMQSYRRYLDETARSPLTPEAMRRLADLKLEREFGIIGDGTRWIEMEAPVTVTPAALRVSQTRAPTPRRLAAGVETDEEFELRTTAELPFAPAGTIFLDELPAAAAADSGPLEAIEIYRRLLEEYPNYERRDQVLYQMARAYDELGRTEEALAVMERLIGEFGYSKYADEVQFRRGEYFFTRRMYRDAETAYQAITAMGAASEFYELALYKLGWTLYKQDFYDEALHQYMALLDYKLSIGYDFDAAHEEEDERRVADTFRVISLSFSNLGGPDVISEYYAENGNRPYEDRIYKNLAEFYFDKLRYNDAAAVYDAFIERYAFHRVAPDFSMRVIEIYDAGGFPMLVVESKKDFATRYGLTSEYWRHYDVAERPEVEAYLKTNLTDLANHYHALYQDEALADDKPANYAEAQTWYRAFLASFPAAPESPGINYQLADLMLENADFGDAAREYERTAYEYETHERAAAAGYAAIYAHRENLKIAPAERELEVKRATVESSLRFADTFPEHEQADVVLGAAAQDLYAMDDYVRAAAAGRTLIERYPGADTELLRSAWTVVAHSSFELEDFPAAEPAYAEVLELTPQDDDGRQALVDNYAAAIYKQGEQAAAAEDHALAASHFLRIKQVAPTSAVRPAAEYDAAAALMKVQNWSAAATVLDEFRAAFPDHELNAEATKQLAYVYREDGALDQAAAEYERVAAESDDPELERQALLEAGDLYVKASDTASAIGVYERYVTKFPRPVEIAVETRQKVADMYKARFDDASYRAQLEAIVAADAAAGAERTARTRFLAANAALVLNEPKYAQFSAVRLVQPFEQSLARKRALMDDALATFEGLTAYEVGDVTAAATFYMAEIYADFSRALLTSERPTGLDAAEREEYELVLEEEAFPFEELAIEVHEQNLELIQAGVYTGWIERSLSRLGELMPGRYLKPEESVPYMGSLETFTYRSPAAAAAAEAAAAAAAAAEAAGEERSSRDRRGSERKLKDGFTLLDDGGFAIVEDVRVDGSVRAAYEGALRDLAQGMSGRGVAALAQIAAEQPELVNAHVDLGLAYAQSDDLEHAAAELEQAVALSPGHPVALTALGLVYRKQGRFDAARTSYERALETYPDLHVARRNIGVLCDLYLKDARCAFFNYQRYAELVPEDEAVRIWIEDLRLRANL